VTQFDVPPGPAAEFQHAVSAALIDGPAHDAVVRAAAELAALLAPGSLGNAQCAGSVSIDYPDTLIGTTCAVSLSINITYPDEVISA